MTILTQDCKVLVQGITGKRGRFHAQEMALYGTEIVGGVSPGKGGEWVNGLPVFDSVDLAVEMTGANTSVIFVPPAFAADAIFEAVDAEIKLIVCVTEGIPMYDMTRVYNHLKDSESRLIGPNCPGIFSPGTANIGIMPSLIGLPGHIGVISRSGALTYDVVNSLSNHNLGQSTIVGVGGDPIVGTSYRELLDLFEFDPDTEHVVLLGEIGGRLEVEAAAYIKSHMTKRVVAFIAGRTAPTDRRMGHAGAIIQGGIGTAEEKIEALRDAGARVVFNPEDIPMQLQH